MTEATPLSIRPLASCLAAEWHDLWQTLAPQEDATGTRQQADALFARLTAQNGTDGGLIVQLDGRPVGLAHYRIERGTDPLDSALHVTDLLLRPEASGKGAGAHLVAFLYMTAEAHRTPLVYWTSAATALRGGLQKTRSDRKAA
ncbi:MAG: GNAT family N-acetyltransferase [Pseudorhodobacter sp.]